MTIRKKKVIVAAGGIILLLLLAVMAQARDFRATDEFGRTGLRNVNNPCISPYTTMIPKSHYNRAKRVTSCRVPGGR